MRKCSKVYCEFTIIRLIRQLFTSLINSPERFNSIVYSFLILSNSLNIGKNYFEICLTNSSKFSLLT